MKATGDCRRFLVTGGAGFIGSAFIRELLLSTPHEVLNVDVFTYAGNPDNLTSVATSQRYRLEVADICDASRISGLFETFRPEIVVHFAAESHVDRSIDRPAAFLQTNVTGTYTLLEAARRFWNGLAEPEKSRFRFLHVSTDEVYGDLGEGNGTFIESDAYVPSSPYSASKAASDHLVRAWYRTYGLPIIVTHSSNNYGPFQFPEKLIPHMVLSAFDGKPLPVYGRGNQVRDWLYVEDHARALVDVAMRGRIEETYNIGGSRPMRNLDVVGMICDLLDEMIPGRRQGIATYRDLITFVRDRPGHDVRYAIDSGKIEREMGWSPHETFESGLGKTIRWYLENTWWWEKVLDGSYRLERIGV